MPGLANYPNRENEISSQGSAFIRCLVVVQVEGLPILCSLTNDRYDMNQIAGTRVYISLLPANTSIICSFHITYTGSIVTALSSNAWLELPYGHVTCPVPGNRQPDIDIVMET
jgi:hypothetical protein